MAKGQGKRISDEIRAQVIAALLQGQGVTQIADTYKLPKGTISRFKKYIPDEKLKQVETEKRDNISKLISEHLETGLQAAVNIAKLTNENEWLFQQPASELATLYGVITDKAIRILEAIENANAARDEQNDA